MHHYLKSENKMDTVNLLRIFTNKICNMIKWNLKSSKNFESIFSAPSPLLLIIHSQIAWWFMKTAIMLPRVLHSNSQFWLFKSNIGWMDARGTWRASAGVLFSILVNHHSRYLFFVRHLTTWVLHMQMISIFEEDLWLHIKKYPKIFKP